MQFTVSTHCPAVTLPENSGQQWIGLILQTNRGGGGASLPLYKKFSALPEIN